MTENKKIEDQIIDQGVKLHKQRGRLFKWIVTLVIIIILVILVIVGFDFYERLRPSGSKQVLNSAPELIERGRYLATAGDCASCHTTKEGAMYAGGYKIDTAFGTIYSSNITPSADYGIGRWTADDFYRSISEGVSPIHRNLYPAMPYPYYANITREDSDAMYAYFMSVPAVDEPSPSNELSFPYNQRAMLMGWNMLFFDKSPLPAVSKGDSDAWKRGEYLVNTLGHCAMCHTPMGDFGEVEREKMFTGNVMGRFSAPDITPEGLAARGWTQQDLERYFAEGIAPQGSAFSDMYLVVHNSTSQLTPKDISAVATFLLGDQAPAPKVVDVKADALQGTGYDSYLNMCSGCHNLDGSGKPNVSVPLVGNSTVMNPDSRNLIVSILDGLPWQSFPNDERFQSMPAFATELSDDEVATLVNFLRTAWGDLSGDVTVEDVKALRE